MYAYFQLNESSFRLYLLYVLYVCMYVCMYVLYICVYVYVCMHVYVCMCKRMVMFTDRKLHNMD